MCSHQRQGALQHRLTYGHQKVISEVGNPAADKNMAGIKEIDQTGQYVADHFATLTDDIQRGLISLPASHVDVFRAKASSIRFTHLAQDRADPVPSGIHRL